MLASAYCYTLNALDIYFVKLAIIVKFWPLYLCVYSQFNLLGFVQYWRCQALLELGFICWCQLSLGWSWFTIKLPVAWDCYFMRLQGLAYFWVLKMVLACQIIANLKYFMKSVSCILREYSACALLLDPSSSLIREVARLLKIHSQDLPQSLLHRLQ